MPVRIAYAAPMKAAQPTFQTYKPQFTHTDLRETDVKLTQDFKSAQALVYGEHLVNDFSR